MNRLTMLIGEDQPVGTRTTEAGLGTFLELRLPVRLQDRHGPAIEIHRPAASMRLRFAELHVVVHGEERLTDREPTLVKVDV